jgi:hypothetical protein
VARDTGPHCRLNMLGVVLFCVPERCGMGSRDGRLEGAVRWEGIGGASCGLRCCISGGWEADQDVVAGAGCPTAVMGDQGNAQ